jgi:hypothetical protein
MFPEIFLNKFEYPNKLSPIKIESTFDIISSNKAKYINRLNVGYKKSSTFTSICF